MVLVVVGHVSFGIDSCANVVSPFTSWIHTFHLGIFAFASGYFFKDESVDKPHLYILKKAKRLLIPLFLYNIVYGLFVLALRQGDFTMGKEFSLYNLFVELLISGHQFDFNLGGWFIIPFFMVEVFVCLLRFCFRKFKNNILKSFYLSFLFV
ncbi:MAG: acyltransferase family protein [Bacilli bacterium]|nr:acyltransferase family protein [Bacilli bacterium]